MKIKNAGKWTAGVLLVVAITTIPQSLASKKSKNSARLENDSRIKEVTIFRDRASVKRTQTASIKKGMTSVSFSGLTPLLDLESLKASLGQRSGLTIMGIRTQTEFASHSGNALLEKWIENRKGLEERRQGLLNQVNGLIQTNENLSLLSQHYRDSFSLNLHQNTWSKAGFGEFIKFLTTQSEKLNHEWASIYRRYQETSLELEFANAKINELNSVSDRKWLSVTVDLLAEKSVETPVEIQYLVMNCGWSSSYDLRINSKIDEASLEHYAFVWQRTGEDWAGVELTLSHSNSELRPQVPSISSYQLSYREVGKVETQVVSGMDSTAPLTVGTQSAASDGAPEGKGIARTFKVPGKQSIRDGLARTRVFISRKETAFKEQLEVVAAQYPKVYRKGYLENPFAWDLEPGPMSVYYNSGYQQQFEFEGIAKGNKFSVNSGVDHDIQISRWTNEKTQTPGVLDSRKHFLREVSNHLVNFSSRRKSVRIYEQIPKSEIKEVSIDIPKSSPGLNSDPDHESWHYWDITLSAKKSQTVSLNLDVAVPKDFQFNW